MTDINVRPAEVDHLSGVALKGARRLEDCGTQLARLQATLRSGGAWTVPGWAEMERALTQASRLASATSRDLSDASRALHRYAEDLGAVERSFRFLPVLPQLAGSILQAELKELGIMQAKGGDSSGSSEPVTPQPGDWVESGHILPGGGEFPYQPPKGSHGKPKKVHGAPSFEDAKDRTWSWDKSGHQGPHWDVVNHRAGTRWNVDQAGKILNEGHARFSHETAPAAVPGAVTHAAGVLGAGASAAAGLSRLLHDIDAHLDLGPIDAG